MIAKDENLLVKVFKKAVGLPTSNASCGCAAAAVKATDCDAETPEKATSECGCASVPVQEEKQPAQL